MSLVFRLSCTLLPMFVMQVSLQATGPLVGFYGFLAAGCCIPLLPPSYRRYASLSFFGLGAFIGLALIVIQPLSGFLIWFDLVNLGAMRGPVSVVFMYLGGYLSLAASFGVGPGRRLGSLLQVLLVNFMLAFIILRLWWLLALAGSLLPVLVISALYCKPPPRYRRRGFTNLTGLALLAGLITVVFVPERVPSGIFLIDQYLSGFLRDAVFRFLPEFPVLYGFSGYGHGFSEEKLGGRPLLSERALFAVEGQAGSTYYLRTKSFDTFTGNGWINSRNPSDDHVQGILSEAGVAGPSAPGGLASGWQTLLSLSLLMDYYPLVPQILGATTVLPGRSGDGLLHEGSPATGLALVKPLVYGERLFVGRENRSVPRQDHVTEIELYLSLPEALPPGALELGASLLRLSEAEKTKALAAFLDEGFTYSLDPVDQRGVVNHPGNGNKPGEAGFLHYFLSESRTGYCVHFASAAVLLARLAGVPARYVTGFLVSIPQPEDDTLEIDSGGLVQTEITGLNSHAWAELWLPSTGWTTFEATPPMRQEAGESGSTQATAASLDEFTLRQLAAITGGRIDLRAAGTAGFSCTLTPARLALVLLVLVLVLLAAAGLHSLARQSGWHPGNRADWWQWICAVWRSDGPDLQDFSKKARRVVRLASASGVPGPDRSGWLAWEENLAALLARQGIDLDALDPSDQPSSRPTSRPTDLTRLDLEVFREVFFGCRLPEAQDFIHADKLAKYLHNLSRQRSTGVQSD